MMGTRQMSGSAAMRLRNFVIVASPSMSASSTLMSRTLAPLSTCCFAIARHASQSPAFSAFANLGEPVMLVRSPTTRKLEADLGADVDIQEIVLVLLIVLVLSGAFPIR